MGNYKKNITGRILLKYAFHSDTMVSFPIGEINEVFLEEKSYKPNINSTFVY